MRGIRIVKTARALPQKCMTNDELCEFVDSNDEWIKKRTGIEKRYVCTDENSVSLAIEATKIVLNASKINKEEIGAIVVATTTQENLFPSVACSIQNELDFPTEIMAFDMNAACAGFLYGISVCKGLLETLKKRYILLVGSENLTGIVDYNDRSSCILFGDGAAAIILELSEKMYHQRLWADGNFDALHCQGVKHPGAKIFMDGNKVFRFAVTALQDVLEKILMDMSLTIDDVDYVVCHQANKRIIDYVAAKYPGNEAKFYTNIMHYGNTSSASIPIALDEMYEKNMLREGMKIVLIGFGGGFTYSGAILEL